MAHCGKLRQAVRKRGHRGRRHGANIAAERPPERSAGTGKQFAAPEMRLTIYSAKTGMPLWMATEHPRYALKKKDIENHEVEAAERTLIRLHDLLEPPSK